MFTNKIAHCSFPTLYIFSAGVGGDIGQLIGTGFFLLQTIGIISAFENLLYVDLWLLRFDISNVVFTGYDDFFACY